MKRVISIFIHHCRIYCFILSATAALIYIMIMVNAISVRGPSKDEDFVIPNGIISSTNENLDLQAHLRKQLKSHNPKFSHLLKRSETSGVKVILLWSPVFTEMNFLKLGSSSFETFGCSEIRCKITSDRNRLLESDAVLFHIRTTSVTDIPRNRSQHQKWIFFSLEAPPYSHFHGFDFMYGMFNWTMTYRGDSDIIISYGRVLTKTNAPLNISYWYPLWKGKTKLATWMVSHCSTDGNREKYIQQLKTYIDVDTYGYCGLASCPFNKTSKCLENFSKHYFFFLAFENSICDDYITEKLFRTMKYDMIPVVFGGGSYEDIAPRDSYINAMDFASPVALSSHLLRIASNFTLYSGYFKWRSEKYVEDSFNHCELCRKLHSKSFHDYSSYHDMKDWWVGKSHCRKWNGSSYVKAH